MKVFYRYIVSMLLLSVLACPVCGQTILPNVVLPADWKQKDFTVRLKDDLKHPQFSWPLTRLKYHLDVRAAAIDKNQISIVDAATGKPVDFQLSDVGEKDGLAQSAMLSILTDMPSGADKSFRISAGKASAIVTDGVKVQKNVQGITLNNGLVKIQLPGI